MRASLLIHCSQKEAQEIRKRAGLQRRTVSGYVVNIVMRSVQFSEDLASTLPHIHPGPSKQGRAIQPRTTMHIYCAAGEAERIREIAELRDMTLSGFVLSCLRRSWESEDDLARATKASRRPGLGFDQR